MKPDWKYAPIWAEWLIDDGVGSYWWCEDKPALMFGVILQRPKARLPVFAATNNHKHDPFKEWAEKRPI